MYKCNKCLITSDRLPLNCPITSFPIPCDIVTISARDPLLVEREKTHGSFSHTAAISQGLKAVMKDNRRGIVTAEHDEALDMICLKLARILSGQANFKDHWDDIAGYAKLGAEACE